MRCFIITAISFIMLSLLNPCFASDSKISWTEEELRFMESHPIIRLGIDPSFVPFEFIDNDGQYKGITADYINLLSKKTGLEMKIVEGLTWPEAYEKALKREIDVLPAISKTVEREKNFLFCEPYYHFKRVIVMKDTNVSIKGIEDLYGKTIAVQKNSSHHSYLIPNPGINLSLYESAEAALTSVANGSEVAFLGNLATSNYLIRSYGLTNLKFVAFDETNQQAIHFAVRTDWPELVAILNKAIGTISQEEKISINSKWIGLETEFEYGPIIRIILGISLFIILIWAVSIYWIIRLRKEVEKRKRIQEDLEKAKHEAEVANNIKSSFMARMSHEIRTPLNAITGMAYLLKKTNVSLTQKMYLERIVQASNNMLRIINDILDFSKIEAGKVEIDRTCFCLDEVIQEVVNIVTYKIEEQGIEFKMERDSELPNWFIGDAKRIQQILLNIINNAAKFTTSGGISFDVKLVARKGNQCYLLFSVKDTGIGMSEEQVKHLFEPFVQGDASINRRFGGTGLGLSIAKNLIEKMNGEIKVYSSEGEGSTFIINLELEVDVEKEKDYEKQISIFAFKDIKTLVLGKTEESIILIEKYLISFGMNCGSTSSETDAVKMLEAADNKLTKPFDLFIIDFDTNAEKGFEFVDKLYQNEKISKIPRIIMLLPMMREDLIDSLEEHRIEIGIGKPIIPSILFNGILEIFKSKTVVTNQVLQIEESEAKQLSKEHCGILVVEDNKTNQLIIKSLLQQMGFSFWLADDGQKGVETYTKFKKDIDLILMDLHMPILNGYDAAIKIREISKDVPIVALTADVISGVREKCEACGIYDYISKPFEPEHFIDKISHIIKTSSKASDVQENILDKTKGLKYLGNNTVLYKLVLAQYYKENKETIDHLSYAIKERKYDEAIQIIHKVKSSSEGIGASKLHSVASTLQKALEVNELEKIMDLHNTFNKYMKEVLYVIEESDEIIPNK